MQDPTKSFSLADQGQMGIGDVLKDQLAIKSEAARKTAMKGQGASDAELSMDPTTRSLYNMLQGPGDTELDKLLS